MCEFHGLVGFVVTGEGESGVWNLNNIGVKEKVSLQDCKSESDEFHFLLCKVG